MREPKTTVEFLQKLRLRLLWPSNGPLTNVQLLSLASDALESRVWPILENAAVDYLTTNFEIPVNTFDQNKETAGTFSLPADGYLRLSRVWYLDGVSNRLWPLTRVQENEIYAHRSTTGRPYWYYFRAGRIVLHPTPTSGYVRVQFHSRPLPMVEFDDSGVNTYRRVFSYGDDSVITVSNLPDGWDGTSDLLVLSPTAPHCPVAYIDAGNITGHTTNELTVDAATQWPWSTAGSKAPILTDDLIIHNYVSPIVQVPGEGLSWLLSLTEELATDGRTDQSKKNLLMSRLSREEDAFMEALQPRDADGQVYVPENRSLPFLNSSWLRR